MARVSAGATSEIGRNLTPTSEVCVAVRADAKLTVKIGRPCQFGIGGRTWDLAELHKASSCNLQSRLTEINIYPVTSPMVGGCRQINYEKMPALAELFPELSHDHEVVHRDAGNCANCANCEVRRGCAHDSEAANSAN